MIIMPQQMPRSEICRGKLRPAPTLWFGIDYICVGVGMIQKKGAPNCSGAPKPHQKALGSQARDSYKFVRTGHEDTASLGCGILIGVSAGGTDVVD